MVKVNITEKYQNLSQEREKNNCSPLRDTVVNAYGLTGNIRKVSSNPHSRAKLLHR